MESLRMLVPPHWLEPIWLAIQVVALVLAGYLLQRLVARAVTRLSQRYALPPQLLLPVRGGLRWLIMGSALMLVLERFGVSVAVIWAALSGFIAVAAVAFFAVWSVLSNLFCSVLIIIAGPYRLGEHIEVLEGTDSAKPGVKGRVSDINLLYTTLEESSEDGARVVVQIPNSLIFQKAIRRWRGSDLPIAIERQARERS